jgi:hypothetical protein
LIKDESPNPTFVEFNSKPFVLKSSPNLTSFYNSPNCRNFAQSGHPGPDFFLLLTSQQQQQQRRRTFGTIGLLKSETVLCFGQKFLCFLSI